MGKDCNRGLQTMRKDSGSKSRASSELLRNAWGGSIRSTSSHPLGKGGTRFERGSQRIEREDKHFLHGGSGGRDERGGNRGGQKGGVHPNHFGKEDLEVWNGKPLPSQHPAIWMGRSWVTPLVTKRSIQCLPAGRLVRGTSFCIAARQKRGPIPFGNGPTPAYRRHGKKGGVWREESMQPFFLNYWKTPYTFYIPGLTYISFGRLRREFLDFLSFYRISGSSSSESPCGPLGELIKQHFIFYMLNWNYIRTQNIEMSRKKFIFQLKNYSILSESYKPKGK